MIVISKGLLVVLVVTIFHSSVECAEFEGAARDRLPREWTWGTDTQGPLCGVYAASRAMSQVGISVSPAELCNSSVVGQRTGSTPAELAAAIHGHGGVARIRSAMSLLELHAAGGPVIVNVRSHPTKKSYDHWACVEVTDDGIVFYEGSSRGRVMPAAALLATWSGIGIVVSRDQTAYAWTLFARALASITLVSVAFAPVYFLKDRFESKSHQMFALVVSVVLTWTCSAFLLRTASGYSQGCRLALMPYKHSGSTLNSVGLEELVSATEDGDALVVDARRQSSFRLGSLPNSVNVPVDAPRYDVDAYLKKIPKNTKVYVFCQSANCNYDHVVARTLSEIGFADVSVAEIGFAEYMDWSAANTR